MDYDYVVAQTLLLGIVALIGVVFTFALPVPNHKTKASSGVFARLFLAACWLVEVFQTVRLSGYEDIGRMGFYVMSLSAAYMLMMTIIKRYGHSLNRQQTTLVFLHLVGVALCSLLLQAGFIPQWTANTVILLSVAYPVWQAIRRVKFYLATNSLGDKVLYAVLSTVFYTLLAILPIYLIFFDASIVHHHSLTFAILLVFMLVFMLSFAVSVLHSLVNRLHTQVHTDPLTGAKNRHFFYEIAPKLSAHALRNNEILSVVACDIDHFKAINDKHGHVVGDIALKRFCKIIKDELRAEDTLIRMGGEEFLVLSPHCDRNQATELAERLRKVISETEIEAKGVNLMLTASFGVIEMTHNSEFFSSVKEADQALYNAKAAGRNQVITV
ncbi:GGDEF domain-containing protein [Marisediminitalea aggregata]|jgi:diguanylate cyclase (GGDEF)-like protein|uniref:GGDEF domain-containing protein n=1 Tax=Marisediminitalea aggregata TaxID=634436 RepID=UPI0020CC89E4|nr:diguanylate cyclase [Marisediminitalea aggregata]MCP9477731.1 GGDEF domain-containing protein [Marisediminitalea aggregata]